VKEKPEVKDYAYTLKLLQHEWTPISLRYSPFEGHSYLLLPYVSKQFTAGGKVIIKELDPNDWSGSTLKETIDYSYILNANCATITYKPLIDNSPAEPYVAVIIKLTENLLVTIYTDSGSSFIDSLAHD